MPELNIDVVANLGPFSQAVSQGALKGRDFSNSIRGIQTELTKLGSTVTGVAGTFLKFDPSQGMEAGAKNFISVVQAVDKATGELIVSYGQQITAQEAVAQSGFKTVDSYQVQIQALDALIATGAMDVAQLEQARTAREGLVATLARVTGGYLNAKGEIEALTDAERTLRQANITTTRDLFEQVYAMNEVAQAAKQVGDTAGIANAVGGIQSLRSSIQGIGADSQEIRTLLILLDELEQQLREAVPAGEELVVAGEKTAASIRQEIVDINNKIAAIGQETAKTQQLRKEKVELIRTYQSLAKGNKQELDALEGVTQASERAEAANVDTREGLLQQIEIQERVYRSATRLNEQTGQIEIIDPVQAGQASQNLEKLRGKMAELEDAATRLGGQPLGTLQQRIFKLDQQLGKSQKAYQAQQQALKQSTFAMQNFGFIIQDSAQLSQGFDQWLRAIANNLDATILSFTNLSNVVKQVNLSLAAQGKQTLPVAATTWKLLLDTLKGPFGVLIAVNTLTSAFTVLNSVLGKNKNTTEDYTKALKNIIDVNRDFVKFSIATSERADEFVDIIQRLKDEQKEYLRSAKGFRVPLGGPDVAKPLQFTSEEDLDRLQETVGVLDGAKDVLKDWAKELKAAEVVQREFLKALTDSERLFATIESRIKSATVALQKLQIEQRIYSSGRGRELRDLELAIGLTKKLLELDSERAKQRRVAETNFPLTSRETGRSAPADLIEASAKGLAQFGKDAGRTTEEISASLRKAFDPKLIERPFTEVDKALAEIKDKLINVYKVQAAFNADAGQLVILLDDQLEIEKTRNEIKAAQIRLEDKDRQANLDYLKRVAKFETLRTKNTVRRLNLESTANRAINRGIGAQQQIAELIDATITRQETGGLSAATEILILREKERAELVKARTELEALQRVEAKEVLALEQLVASTRRRIEILREESLTRAQISRKIREEILLSQAQNVNEATRLDILRDQNAELERQVERTEQIAENLESAFEVLRNRIRSDRSILEQLTNELRLTESINDENERRSELKFFAPVEPEIPEAKSEVQVALEEETKKLIRKQFTAETQARYQTTSLGLDEQRNVLLKDIRDKLFDPSSATRTDLEDWPTQDAKALAKEFGSVILPGIPDPRDVRPGDTLYEGVADVRTLERVERIGEALADKFGLRITSQLRSVEVQDELAPAGSEYTSYHEQGMALDVAGAVDQMQELEDWARKVNKQEEVFAEILFGSARHYDHVHLAAIKDNLDLLEQMLGIQRQLSAEEIAAAEAAKKKAEQEAQRRKELEESRKKATEGTQKLEPIQANIVLTPIEDAALEDEAKRAQEVFDRAIAEGKGALGAPVAGAEDIGILRTADSPQGKIAAADERSVFARQVEEDEREVTKEYDEQIDRLYEILRLEERRTGMVSAGRLRGGGGTIVTDTGEELTTDRGLTSDATGEGGQEVGMREGQLDDVLARQQQLKDEAFQQDVERAQAWENTYVGSIKRGQQEMEATMYKWQQTSDDTWERVKMGTGEWLFTTEAGMKAFTDMTSTAFSAVGTFAQMMYDKSEKKSKKWFNVMKGVNAAQALIETYVGINAALKLPPPVNWIQAGLVAATGFANVAAILATQPGSGKSGGKVGGLVDRAGIIDQKIYGTTTRENQQRTGGEGSYQPTEYSFSMGSDGPVPVSLVSAASSFSLPIEQQVAPTALPEPQVPVIKFDLGSNNEMPPLQMAPLTIEPIEVSVSITGETRLEGNTLVTAIEKEVQSQMVAGIRDPLGITG